MYDNAGEVCIFNEVMDRPHLFEKTTHLEGHRVYEVIRIIDGVPLFLEDHYDRMKNSMSILGKSLKISMGELDSLIRKLTAANGLSNCNVKSLAIIHDEVQDLLLHISKSYYPQPEEYQKGVRTGLFRWVRKNPNVKLQNDEYREAVARIINEKQVFEVLLVNADGNITEGSRSNVFFIKGDAIITSPAESVLKGITRKYVIDACNQLGFNVSERFIAFEELSGMDGLFISGTSIKVLPVSHVDGLEFKSSQNNVIAAVMDRYDGLIKEYVGKRKHSDK
jgi:branched-chain amino acid aminotransferase